jgi:hypothetical protein
MILESEASASQLESTALLNALVESRTEASGLSTLLGLSEQSLKASEQSMANERELARKALEEALRRGSAAEQSRDFWRTVAAGAAIFGAFGWSAFAVCLSF